MDDFHQLRRPSSGGAFPRDIGASEVSARRALAKCRINHGRDTTTAAVAANAMNKGDVLATARVAGIQAAKHAATLLPMSHPVLVGNVHVNFTIADTHIDVEASVDTVDRTGRRDGGSDGRDRRRAHGLRHVQVGRPNDDHRAGRDLGEVRWAIGDVATRRRARQWRVELTLRSDRSIRIERPQRPRRTVGNVWH